MVRHENLAAQVNFIINLKVRIKNIMKKNQNKNH